ncbi:MAG: molybdenum cofactor guanylyltransferase [Planctomycetes bacterium]|nr:molybdenum cofactor guanylyltransferase [Planctomycetota bacterium]
MGRDKARVELDGRSLIERALAVLDGSCATVALACGGAPRYAELGRALVLDRIEDGGPLAGIEAALASAPPGHVVVLAVDLPRVDAAFLEGLLARARAEDLDACLARSPFGLEPLCGVYHTRLAPRIRALLDRGERKVTSALVFELEAHALPRWAAIAVDAHHGATRNVNTPADLEAARAPLDERKATA